VSSVKLAEWWPSQRCTCTTLRASVHTPAPNNPPAPPQKQQKPRKSGASAEILEHVSRQTRCVLVMDGRDLALILEGQMTLPEALDLKSRRAAQEGVLFHSLAERIA
jgi:hypothetical protein